MGELCTVLIRYKIMELTSQQEDIMLEQGREQDRELAEAKKEALIKAHGGEILD